MTIPVDVLDTWATLNEAMKSADEKLCEQLLACEIAGKCRKVFVYRIYSRYNRMRAARERQELIVKMGR